MSDTRGEKAIGTATMVGRSVSKRIGSGKSEVMQEFKSEAERVTALEQWFGVKLRDDEINGIVGMPTEIRASVSNA